MTNPTKRVQSERWLAHITKILDGSNDHLFSQAENDKTFQYVLGCLETLLSGAALSEKQKNLLIKNIQLRIPGKGAFAWTDLIQLTAKQVRDARQNSKLRGYSRALDTKKAATSFMMEEVRDLIGRVGFDLDTLTELRLYLRAFEPSPAEALPVEPVVAPVVAVTVSGSGPDADQLLGRFGYKTADQRKNEGALVSLATEKQRRANQ